jgi:hypothetical protein
MKNPLDHSYQLIVKALNALVQGIKIDQLPALIVKALKALIQGIFEPE